MIKRYTLLLAVQEAVDDKVKRSPYVVAEQDFCMAITENVVCTGKVTIADVATRGS